MPIVIRSYEEKDVPAMRAIWNEVVEEGVAFPQTEPLGEAEASSFFCGADRLPRGRRDRCPPRRGFLHPAPQ